MSEGRSTDRPDRATYQVIAAPPVPDPDPSVEEYLGLAACGHDRCVNSLAVSVERPWLELMTAVPVSGQRITPMDGGMKMPAADVLGDFVKALRPEDQDACSLEATSEAWKAMGETLAEMASTIKSGLADLGGGWSGVDFDLFDDSVSMLVQQLQSAAFEITEEDGMVAQLDALVESIGRAQTDEGTPYPPVGLSPLDDRLFGGRVHVRAPYTATCKTEESDSMEEAAELAGFTPNVVGEAADWVESRAEHKYEEGNSPETAEQLGQVPGWYTADRAREEAEAEFENRWSEGGVEAYEKFRERAEGLEREVRARCRYADEALREFTPSTTPLAGAWWSEVEREPYPGLEKAATRGGGNPPQIEDYTDPTANPDDLVDDNPEVFERDWEGGGGGAGAGGGGLAGGGGAGSVSPGGLSSGGAGQGGPGGGPGAGTGAGMAGAGGAGTAGVGGAGGMMMGGGGGMAGAPGGADGNSEGEAANWLVEEDNVWGVEDEDDDPYA
ncbi:WXG100 family type VII secretion target [Salininema proteolyticum]|uniref:WXG100 family type VII secretion target n=1 Tax=Salininema proteolyticum TaxID=1607685 RepID=A0ABV8U2J3_9ACTN